MNFLKTVFFIGGFIISSRSNSQTSFNNKIEIIENKNIAELMQKQKEINYNVSIKGYRIKIHFGTDKMVAKEVKSKFISKFPEIMAYEKYDQPNFNIRVGDFRTKLEAYKFLKEVQLEFTEAFIVQDEIELPSLE